MQQLHVHMPQNSRCSFDEMSVTKDVSLDNAAAQCCIVDRDHQDKADTDGKSLICKVYEL